MSKCTYLVIIFVYMSVYWRRVFSLVRAKLSLLRTRKREVRDQFSISFSLSTQYRNRPL
jgi:hypothetical protein